MPVVLLLLAVLVAPRISSPCPGGAWRSGGPGDWPTPGRSTAEIAREYLRECFEERDLEGAFGLLADALAFVDPTAEVWGGPAFHGVTGSDAFRQLTEGWNIERSHFEVEHSFVSGEYAVFAGAISWQAKGQPLVEGVPFCTVLRVENGEITQRTDYGDYDDVLGQDAGTGPLGKAAERFFAAYAALDLEALDAVLAEQVTREDPIGATFGRPAAVSGKVHVLADLEQAKSCLRGFEFETAMSFVSGTHAFVFGTARYDVVDSGIELRLEHPYVHVVRFEEGKVVQHRRYLDYAAIDRQVAGQVGAGASRENG